MLNNYLHDVATALLVASAFVLFVAARAFRRHPGGVRDPRFLEIYRRMTRLALGALAWIVLGGFVRAWAYRDFEWANAVGANQVPALVAKHIVMGSAVALGAWGWIRLGRRMRGVTALLLAALAAGILGGCSGDPAARAVARVNGEEISRRTLEVHLAIRTRQFQERHRGDVMPAIRETMARQVLSELIASRLILQAARARGLRVGSDEVERVVQEARKPFPDDAAFGKALEEWGLSLADFRAHVEGDLLSQKFSADFGKHLQATDVEALAFYRENREQFRVPEKVRVRIMLAGTAEEARALLWRIRAGRAAFEEVAKVQPVHPGQEERGEPGWRNLDSFAPGMAQAIRRTKPGGLAGPVKGGVGAYILRVEEKQASTMPEFPAVRERILHVLTQQKRQRALQEWIAAQKQGARIDILDPSLREQHQGKP